MRFILLSILLTITPWGISAELEPFRAEYIAAFQGLPVKARGTRSLEKIDTNLYRLSSSADSLMVKVLETSEFELVDGKLIPQHYQYERKGIGRNKFEASEFDWGNEQVSHGDSNSPLTPATLDKLSYQYQLRMDVAEAISSGTTNTEMTYTIADEEKRKQYVFRIAGEETLSTPMGELDTVRVDRIHDDDEIAPYNDSEKAQRRTSLWLSIDFSFVLVKLRIEEGDRGFELNLDNFSLAEVAAD